MTLACLVNISVGFCLFFTFWTCRNWDDSGKNGGRALLSPPPHPFLSLSSQNLPSQKTKNTQNPKRNACYAGHHDILIRCHLIFVSQLLINPFLWRHVGVVNLRVIALRLAWSVHYCVVSLDKNRTLHCLSSARYMYLSENHYWRNPKYNLCTIVWPKQELVQSWYC